MKDLSCLFGELGNVWKCMEMSEHSSALHSPGVVKLPILEGSNNANVWSF